MRAVDQSPSPVLAPARGFLDAPKNLLIDGEWVGARPEEFGQLESLDNGKSVAIAQAVDTSWAANVFRYSARSSHRDLPGADWSAAS